MAMSLNGMIARESGAHEFISQNNWETFTKLAKEYGNVILGRKTYEAVKMWGGSFSLDDVEAEKVVVTSDTTFHVEPGYIKAASPMEAIELLSSHMFEKALLTGGGTLNTAFASHNLINEVVFNMEPIIVGEGIPVLSAADFDLKLQLQSVETAVTGIVTMRYSVV